MPLVAGVDSSTQSTKVELRDARTGERQGLATAPHPPTRPPRSEQDPEAWWAAFERCWDQLDRPAVAAIAVAGQQHGMVAMDAAGQVIRPAKLWNDTESAPDAGWLIKQLDRGATAWAEACGSVPVAAFTVTKLSWLHRSEPDHWDRLARVLLPHDWLTWRLTGRCTTDRGDASGTGYWSPDEGAYRWDLLRIVDGERDWFTAVPEVLGPLDDAGVWHAAVVAPGTGDNMAETVARRGGVAILPQDIPLDIVDQVVEYVQSRHTVYDTPITLPPTGTVGEALSLIHKRSHGAVGGHGCPPISIRSRPAEAALSRAGDRIRMRAREQTAHAIASGSRPSALRLATQTSRTSSTRGATPSSPATVSITVLAPASGISSRRHQHSPGSYRWTSRR